MRKETMETLENEGFKAEVACIKAGKCPLCACDIDVALFIDEESVREYEISGMCQECQDNTF